MGTQLIVAALVLYSICITLYGAYAIHEYESKLNKISSENSKLKSENNKIKRGY